MISFLELSPGVVVVPVLLKMIRLHEAKTAPIANNTTPEILIIINAASECILTGNRNSGIRANR
jgi:hypothetical protein